jgi:UDP-N-acetylglucosamine transferase subunit ALG13
VIFLTVGTHEQPMMRLIRALDSIVSKLDEEVIMQYGTADPPSECLGKPIYSYEETQSLISQARIIICHGGPGLILEAISRRKYPIVIPRQHRYGEHVDDHQVKFVRRVEKHLPILSLYETSALYEAIESYDQSVLKMLHDLRALDSSERHRTITEVLDAFVSHDCRNII